MAPGPPQIYIYTHINPTPYRAAGVGALTLLNSIRQHDKFIIGSLCLGRGVNLKVRFRWARSPVIKGQLRDPISAQVTNKRANTLC